MNKPDWKDAPEWADKLMESDRGYKFWCNNIKYLLSSISKPNFDLIYFGDDDDCYDLSDFTLVEMRPDPWAEGEHNIENIVLNGIEDNEVIESAMSVEGYECLREVLVRAYDQAAKGKGDERHAQGDAFEDQPMQKLIDLYGVGFALGQSGKKAQESMRLTKDHAIAELLGGIVYLAGAIINMEKSK
jgi:hypothetical protein